MTAECPIPSGESVPPFRGPYPGLRPFFQEDAPRFFGRGKQINAMLERLEDRRFLAIVGASGCGKSSLVYAGLLPALENGYLMDALPHWRMVKLRPGDAPLDNLARELHESLRDSTTTETDLAGVSLTLNTLHIGRFGLLEAIKDAQVPDDTNVLVMVDQFEEIFRYREKNDSEQAKEAVSQSKYERQNESIAFVNLLLTAATDAKRPVYVIITMRSDFLGDCDQFQGLPEAINRSQFLTPRMTRDQLREAIVGPLKLFHAEAEPGLVDRILNEIGTDPDQLPLMQHALMRTWLVAHNAPDEESLAPLRLTAEHYSNSHVGGVSLALNTHAEETYRVFYVSPQASRDGVDLQQQSPGNFIFDVYLKSALLSFGQHVDRLLKEDPQALDRLEQQASTQPRILQRFSKAVFRRLRVILRVLPSEPLSSPRQRICERMFRCLSDVNQRGRVVRRLAKIQEIADVAGVSADEVIAIANPFLDPECSFLTASPKPTKENPLSGDTTLDISHEALLRQWGRLKEWIKTERQSAEIYHRLARQTFLFGKKQASIWRLDDYAPVERWFDREQPTAAWVNRYTQPESEEAGFDDSRTFLKLSRGRERFWAFIKIGLFAASLVFGFFFWRLAVRASLAEKTAQINLAKYHLPNAGFSLRDHRIADAVHWYFLASRDVPKGDLRSQSARSLLGAWSKSLPMSLVHDGSVTAVAFSLDGQTVLTGSGVGTARLWDAHTGLARGEPLKHESAVLAVSFSPDGQTVLTGSYDGTARLWDARTGEARGESLKHEHAVTAVAFSPDGQTVLTGSWDRTARLWDVRTGQARGEPLKHERAVSAVAFSPDGQTVLTGSDDGQDGTALLWNVPPPAADEPERLRLSVEVRTGLIFDETTGTIKRLTQSEWLQRQQRLWKGFGGPCDARTWDQVSEAEKQKLRKPPKH